VKTRTNPRRRPGYMESLGAHGQSPGKPKVKALLWTKGMETGVGALKKPSQKKTVRVLSTREVEKNVFPHTEVCWGNWAPTLGGV